MQMIMTLVQTLCLQVQQQQLQQAQMSMQLQQLMTTLSKQKQPTVDTSAGSTATPPVVASVRGVPATPTVTLEEPERPLRVLMAVNLEEDTWCEPDADKQREELNASKVSLDVVLQHQEGQGLSLWSEEQRKYVKPSQIILDSGSEAHMCSLDQAKAMGWAWIRTPTLTVRTADNKDAPVVGVVPHKELVLNQGSSTEQRVLMSFLVMDVKDMFGMLLSKTFLAQVGGWVDYTTSTLYFRHGYLDGACKGKLGRIPLKTMRRPGQSCWPAPHVMMLRMATAEVSEEEDPDMPELIEAPSEEEEVLPEIELALSEGCVAAVEPTLSSIPYIVEVKGEPLDSPKQLPATCKAGRRHGAVRRQQVTTWRMSGGGHWSHRTLWSVWLFAMLMFSMIGQGIAMPQPIRQPFAHFPMQLDRAGQQAPLMRPNLASMLASATQDLDGTFRQHGGKPERRSV